MKHEIKKLGEDLYEVSMPWWYIGRERLISALLEIQGRGKIVTFVSKRVMTWSDTYLVGTTDKLEKFIEERGK